MFLYYPDRSFLRDPERKNELRTFLLGDPAEDDVGISAVNACSRCLCSVYDDLAAALTACIDIAVHEVLIISAVDLINGLSVKVLPVCL